MSPEEQAAIDAYRAAKTHEEQWAAYARMMEMGLPPSYGETPLERRHDGESGAQARDRILDDLEDPLDRHRASRGRVGWKDLPHAITNIPVTEAREHPRRFGHWVTYATIVALGITFLILVMTVVAIIGWART